MASSRTTDSDGAARPGPRRRDAQANLARILAAATEVFAEHGLTATLADVAAAAGVGVGTVYRTFATKDDLIHEVYEPMFARAEQQALDASLDPDPWTGISVFLEKSITTLAPDRGFRELLSGSYSEKLGWSRPRAPHRLAKLVEDSHNRTGAHLERLVGRARQAGLVRDDLVSGDLLLFSMAVQTSVDRPTGTADGRARAGRGLRRDHGVGSCRRGAGAGRYRVSHGEHYPADRRLGRHRTAHQPVAVGLRRGQRSIRRSRGVLRRNRGTRSSRRARRAAVSQEPQEPQRESCYCR